VTEVREMRTLCSGCGAAVGVDFLACPQCGKRLGGGCPHCGRSMQPGWNFCPYCARSAAEPRRMPKRLRDREVHEGRRELPAANVAEFKK
jgi:RNA polymerase subunit RPABC4/transcription elongation factor Spt4